MQMYAKRMQSGAAEPGWKVSSWPGDTFFFNPLFPLTPVRKQIERAPDVAIHSASVNLASGAGAKSAGPCWYREDRH